MEECNQGSGEGEESVRGIWTAGPFRWTLETKALVMGIVNATPDSFSDGGRFNSINDTVTAARCLVAEGAGILDIGGESTRPGAEAVTLNEELGRVVPLIEALRSETAAALSIDTCKPQVASAALRAGAHIVNDISGLRDEGMIKVCAASDCGIVVVHMKGNPRTMQGLASYDDVLAEVREFFEERLGILTRAGIRAERIVFDPGIGFGKTLAHNLALIEGVGDYRVHGRPILMGLSRKSFIGSLLGDPAMSRREASTQALTVLTRMNGALIHRVHRVREAVDVLRMVEILRP